MDLKKGDVIVALNGLDHLVTPDDFILYLIRETRPGQTVKVTVLRLGKPVTFTFTLPKTGF
jgi:type II secretory pathway component PulC